MRRVFWKEYFGVYNAAFAGVVVGHAVALVPDFLPRTVCRRRDCGLAALAAADDFNLQMKYSHRFDSLSDLI
jgi:hypothetical protein